MVVHRYQKFKKQDITGFAEHTTQYLAIAMSVGICAVSPVAWDVWNTLEMIPGECHVVIDQPMTCNTFTDPCSNFFTVLTVTVVISVSCVFIKKTTVKLEKIIHLADEKVNTILQIKRSTNTSRIQATKLLFYFFTFNWVPYGISRLYGLWNPTFSRFQTVTACFHALSTVLFMIIPIIYYKMDGGFQRYLKNLFSKFQRNDRKTHRLSSSEKNAVSICVTSLHTKL